MTLSTLAAAAAESRSLLAELAEIRTFAVKHHGLQMYGKQPYVAHLDHVVSLCLEYGLPRVTVMAGYAHDLMEDTDVTKGDLQTRYGTDLAEQVDSVTGVGKTRAECRDSMTRKLRERPEHAPLKLMDRLANAEAARAEGREDLVAMYRKEMPHYADIFAVAHPAAFNRLCKVLQWAPTTR